MAFDRARRRLSALGTGSSNRQCRAVAQAKSNSGSTARTLSDDWELHDENPAAPCHEPSVASDKLLTYSDFQKVFISAAEHNGESGIPESRLSKGIPLSNSNTDEFPLFHQYLARPAPVSNTLPVEKISSQNHNRGTSIFAGNLNSQPTRKDSAKDSDDKARLNAEDHYYESRLGSIATRNRSMLRSMSKDDYLVARGANPRTGIVTPGVHSGHNPYDEMAPIKQRDVMPPSKWRQKGDQWVSLDLGEPTPLPSPPKQPKSYYTARTLRIPPRLATERPNRNVGTNSVYQKPSISEELQDDKLTPDVVPGSFPQSPENENRGVVAFEEAASRPFIKRKPVGNPIDTRTKNPQPQQVVTQSSTDTILKHPLVAHPRASSAPISHSLIYERPDDVGKSSAQVFASAQAVQSGTRCEVPPGIEVHGPFLGQIQPERAKDMSISAPSRPEKELPCLPMSNGQYQSIVSNYQTSTRFHAAETTRSEAPVLIGPRGGNQSYPFVRNTKMMIPNRQYQITPKTQTGLSTQYAMGSIPIYDNPPSQSIVHSQPVRSMVRGPRPMYHPRSISDNIKRTGEMFANPPASIPTNMFTPTPTPIYTIQPELRTRIHKNPSEFVAGQDQATYQGDQERIYAQDPRQWSRSFSSSTPSVMPKPGPRAPSRPQMPDRAEAHIDSIPRMKHEYREQQMPMGSRHHWNMTGMRKESYTKSNGNNSKGITNWDTGRKPMQNPLLCSSDNRLAVAPTNCKNEENLTLSQNETRAGESALQEQSLQNSGLMRNCSHCQRGFVGDLPRNIAGPILDTTEESPPEAVQNPNDDCRKVECKADLSRVETTAVPKLVNIDEPLDGRDHTACCLECCIGEGCHEGCLGHASPSIHSISGSTAVDSGQSSSGHEANSSSNSTAVSVNSSPLKGKTSLVHPSRMRKTLRARLGADDGKKITERSNGQQLSAMESDSYPLSPESFWGGDGAVRAAKKALALDKHTGNVLSDAKRVNDAGVAESKKIVSCPKLTVPKIRESKTCRASNSKARSLFTKTTKSRNFSASSTATAISTSSRSRNASGASILSIEIPQLISSFGTVNLSGLWEIFRMPFCAGAMWIQNHPEVQESLWTSVYKAMEMGATVARTAGVVWEVSYVYSKTGNLRCRAPGGIGKLIMDCGRSMGYLLVFSIVAVCIGRVLGLMLGVCMGMVRVVRGVGWMLKKLGLGVFW